MSSEGPLEAEPSMPLDTRGRPISPSRLHRAMNLNILVGIGGMAWYAVCAPQQVMQVFVKNHLNASPLSLGWLVALTQLAAPFHLASIFIYGRLRTRKAFWVAAHVVHRMLGFVLAGVALYAAGGGEKPLGVSIVTAASVVSFILATLSASGWWSWMGDLIPDNIRGTFFGRRSAIIHLVNVFWFFGTQVALDRAMKAGAADLFYVYAFVFGVGGVLGILDIVIHAFIPEPRRHEGDAAIGWRPFLEPLRNPRFLGFSAAVGFWMFSVGILAPFVAPFITAPDQIGAPNLWIGIMFAITQVVWFLTSKHWGIIMDRFGRKPVVILGAVQPLISFTGYLFLTPGNYMFILPVTALMAGVLGPGYWNGAATLMLTLTPQKNRTAFVAWHSVMVGLIAAPGSYLGGWLMQALADFRYGLPGGLGLTGFHVVTLVTMACTVLSVLTLGRIREGTERPVGFVVSRLLNPAIFRTFMQIGTIAGPVASQKAARALRAMEGAAAHLALADVVSRLDDPDPEVREEAARALGRIGSSDAVEALSERLRDPNSTIRPQAARALGQIGDPRAAPALAECLPGAGEELRQACAQALEAIAGRVSVRPQKAARALRTMEADAGHPAVAEVVSRLDDPHPEVREEAVRALGRLGSPEAVDALVARLGDPNPAIPPLAARALGQIGDPRAVSALIQCLSSTTSDALQEACVQALGAIGGRQSVRQLRRLLTEERPERVLASGAEAVSKHGIVEAAWEILPHMHETGNPVLRRQLAIAMGNLLGRPGEFYRFLTGEQARQGAQLGRLFRRVRRSLAAMWRTLPKARQRAEARQALEAEVTRIRGLMEGQSYRAAIDGIAGLVRTLVRLLVGQEGPDDLVLEYALARDAELGLGLWFALEIKQRMGTVDDPELLHIDALLALYFLSAYRLPPPTRAR